MIALGCEPSDLNEIIATNNLIEDCEFDTHQGTKEMLLIFNAKGTRVIRPRFFNKGTVTVGPCLGLWQKCTNTEIVQAEFYNCRVNYCIYYSQSCTDIKIIRPYAENCGQLIGGANRSDNGSFGFTTVNDLVIDTPIAIGGENSANAAAINIGAVVDCVISNAYIEGYQIGIRLNTGNFPVNFPCRDVDIINPHIKNCNAGNISPELGPGIILGPCSRVRITGGSIYDDRATPLQRFAIAFEGANTWNDIIFQNMHLGAIAPGQSISVNSPSGVLNNVRAVNCTGVIAGTRPELYNRLDLPVLTDTERNQYSPISNGLTLLNSTVNKIQSRILGVWENIATETWVNGAITTANNALNTTITTNYTNAIAANNTTITANYNAAIAANNITITNAYNAAIAAAVPASVRTYYTRQDFRGSYGEFTNTAVSGTGAVTTLSSTTAPTVTGWSGVMTLETGSTNSGVAARAMDFSNWHTLSGAATFRTSIQISHTTSALNAFGFRIGCISSLTAVAGQNGIFFRYNPTPAGGNIIAVTQANGVETTTDTGVAIAATTTTNLEFRKNAANTSVEFYINNTLVATHTTNIPSARSQASGMGAVIFKTNDIANRLLHVDFMEMSIV